jgi:hypothetical protein
MNYKAVPSTAPQGSKVQALLPGAYFHDAWAIAAAQPGLDALGQFLRMVKKTPRWIDRLMALRNSVAGLVGLKDLGGLAMVDPGKGSSDYEVGDRVGIFTLLAKEEGEVLLGDDDKHLRVVVSVHRSAAAADARTLVTITTVVHVKNWLGRLYMLPVTPAHRVIGRTMIQAVGTQS